MPRIIKKQRIFLLDKKAILRVFDFIDFIIYKEGELGIVGLLKNLEKRKFDEVPNLVYRKGGRVIENEESVVHNLVGNVCSADCFFVHRNGTHPV